MATNINRLFIKTKQFAKYFSRFVYIFIRMEKKEMILALIEYYSNGNKARFANKLGITPQAISTWITRNTFDTEKIFAKCECVSAEWLLTGKGNMIKNKYPECESYNSIVMESVPIAKKSEDKNEGIPLIPTNAMAGALAGEITVLDYECERYVIPVFKGADFLINIKGLSMYPKYSPGDIVACKKVPLSGLFFQWGKVYVIDTNQGAIIKKVKPAETSDHIKIVSENPDYDPFELNVSDIHSIALVIGVVRLE